MVDTSFDSKAPAALAEPPAIRAHRLTKTYDGEAAPALRNISLEVHRGEIFTLLGPSGCGKTTTLRLLAGLDKPDSGNIYLGSELVSARNVHIQPEHRGLGMVFQNGAVWPHMTVQENVEFPLKARRVNRITASQRVARVLELTGLQGLEDRPATRLSGGQQQRVALARALVTEPNILLLDEPFNGLDMALREQMSADIKRLQQHLNVTVVFVTHDQFEALRLSHRIGLMNEGVLQQSGTPQQLYDYPANEFVRDFLGKCVLLRGTRGKVSSRGRYTVDLDGGRDVTIQAVSPAPDSHRIAVALRPEDLEVITQQQTDTRPSGTLEGRVRAARFAGNRMEYHIDVTEQGLIEAYGGRDFVAREGQAIWLRPRAAGYNIWPL